MANRNDLARQMRRADIPEQARPSITAGLIRLVDRFRNGPR